MQDSSKKSAQDSTTSAKDFHPFWDKFWKANFREVLVNSQDRLVRLGLDLIEWLSQPKDGELVVLNRCDPSNE
jgi:predicted site-specific integrase-resolvase